MTIPIAVIGMSARLPGARNVQEFWDLLLNGRDAITEVPADRWPLARFYDPEFGTPGKTNTRHGGFIANLFEFDHALFGISAREAQRIDPQQLLALELAFSAIENAGIGKPAIAGAAAGVYIGATTTDARYAYLGQLDKLDGYSTTGLSPGVIANRISYFFDLRGPSLVLDTGCSSSLVGLQLAIESLRRGEISLAFVGGVSVMLSPEQHISLSQVNMLAPDGRCRPFDAAADGIVRSEGGGMVLLKRLGDAVRDGDHVRAVVLGAAVNQDGRTQGLTHPNQAAQVAVMRAALADAGVRASDVTVIEAHGTGTRAGDPIELSALSQVYSGVRIGSVKSNIGHLEGGAGVAGLIKLMLQLERQTRLPSIHFSTPNPGASWDGLSVQTTVEPWLGDRVGGLSAFSFGGTNAHVIVASALSSGVHSLPLGPFVLPLSARDPVALGILNRDHPLTPAAAASAAHASHAFDYRSARVQRTGSLNDPLREPIRFREGRAAQVSRVAFVFTGHGPQWGGVGLELAERFGVFRQSLELSAKCLPFDLLATMREAKITRTELLQPLIASLQIACVELLAACGVEPAICFGHSVGEVAAAFAAGVYDRENALALAVARGRALESLRGQGTMVALAKPPSQLPDGISIAAQNGEQTVVSGPTALMATFLAECEKQWIAAQALDVDYPFHSELVDTVVFPALPTGTAQRPIIASADGELRSHFDAAYWRRQARDPVLFTMAMAQLKNNADVVLELGPGKGLSRLMERQWHTGGPKVASALNHDGVFELLDSLGAAWVAGSPVKWGVVYPRVHADRPSYPFQRKRVWPFSPPGSAVPGSAVPDTATLPDVPTYGETWHPIEWPKTKAVTGTLLVLASAQHKDLRALGGEIVLWRQLAEPALRKKLSSVNAVVVVDTSDHFSEAHLLDAAMVFAALARLIPMVKTRVSLLTFNAEKQEQQAFSVGLFRSFMTAHRTQVGLWVDAKSRLSQSLRQVFLSSEPPPALQLQWDAGAFGVARLTPAPLALGHAATQGASYLISGGLGDIGLCLALALAKAGATRIVLLSRRQFPVRGSWSKAQKSHRSLIDSLLSIEAAGATVEVHRCDVSNPKSVRAFFAEEASAARRPFTTIFHLAGTAEPSALAAVSDTDVRNAIGAKLVGARHLHAAVSGTKTKLVVIGGFAGVVGIPSLAAYSAANAALEAFAFRVGCAVVVSGTVKGAGAASRGGGFARFGDQGLEVSALAKVLIAAQASVNKIIAIEADWAVLKDVAPHLGLPTNLAPAKMTSALGDGHVETIRQAAAQLLLVPDLDANDDLFAHGATSLSVMLLSARLKRHGLDAPPALIFANPSASALAAHVQQEQQTESLVSVGLLRHQTRHKISKGLLSSRLAMQTNVDIKDPAALGAAIEAWSAMHPRLRLRVLRVANTWLQGLASDATPVIVHSPSIDLASVASPDRLCEVIVSDEGSLAISLSPWLGDEAYLRTLMTSFTAVYARKPTKPTTLGVAFDKRPIPGAERKPTFRLVKKTKRKR